ncbi:beta strand repeat-containing protein [Salipiger bermudensis]|uniref:beta strand repeat-containing protein n=1 Tax=Salipiger bermudensis TaxID=344736 RepID=UPI0035191282
MNARNVTVEGGDGNDTIQDHGSYDYNNGNLSYDLRGGAGNDTVRGSGYGDTIDGGADDDSLAGNNGDDTIFGGTGDDTLEGNNGNDSLLGGDGDDIFHQNAYSGTGDDTIDGGADNSGSGSDGDVAVYRGNRGDYSIVGTATGLQVINLTSNGDGTDVVYNVERLRFADGDVVVANGLTGSLVTGSPGDDSLVGTILNDTIEGYAGNDTIVALAGEDDIDAGDGDDTIDAGEQNDTVDAGAGDDTIRGGGGDDSIDGGTGTNTAVFSGDLADYTITGDGSASTVTGPDGTDVLTNVRVLQFDDQSYAFNNAPQPVSDSVATDEDTFVDIPLADLLLNDTDPDGDPLSITGVQNATNGTLQLFASFVRFTPASNFNGTANFEVIVSDGFETATSTVTVAVAAVNDLPTVANDSATTNEDTAINIDVLANDSDVEDGTALTVTAVGTTGAGVAVIESDNTVTFTPNADFNGTASFSYTVEDSDGGSRSGTVFVTVSPVNDAPVATDDSGSTAAATPVSVDVMANDSDVDGDTVLLDSVGTASNGTVGIDDMGTPGDASDDRVVYTPNGGFSGSDSFTYTISDGNGATDTATVTVSVSGPSNSAPVAGDDSVSRNEDSGTQNIDVTGNDSDPDGDSLTYSLVSGVSNGTLTPVSNGVWAYAPQTNFNGTDSFTYEVSDGNGGTDQATVTITVAPVNDDPVAIDDTVVTTEDNAVNVAVLTNDSDVDGDTLSVASATNGSNGTTTVEADGTITYTPDANFNGTDSFTYTISDGIGGTDTAAVAVTVTSVNNAPVAVDDAVVTAEDNAVNVAVLTNDSDVDGDTLSVTSATNGSNGTTTVEADGTITYTPDANFNGTDSFTYTISDGNGGTDTAAVAVTVTSVDDAPVAVDDSYSTGFETVLNVPASGVLDNDFDIDGDPLILATFAQATNGFALLFADGSFTYTPDAGFSGLDSFEYDLADGQGGIVTATVEITVAGPVSSFSIGDITVDEGAGTATFTVTRSGNTSVESDVLTVGFADGSATDPADYTAGLFLPFTFAAGQTTTTVSTGIVDDAIVEGDESFFLQLRDANTTALLASGQATITDNDVANSPPDAVDDAVGVFEDTTLTGSVAGNDSDPDGDSLTYALVSDVSNGSLTLQSDGTISYTPDADYNGPDSFTYEASDGNGGTDQATVSLNVIAVNDAPVAVDDTGSVSEDGPAANLGSPLLNDTDVDLDTISIVAFAGVASADAGFFDTPVLLPSGATVTLNSATGEFSYDPNGAFEDLAVGASTTDSFTYTISDGNGGTDTATVTVTIDGANDAPVYGDFGVTTNEDTGVVVPFETATDVDGDSLTYSVQTGPTNGTATFNALGELIYTPAPDFFGSDSFTLLVDDGNGGTDTAVVNVTVDPVNDAPIAVDDSEFTLAGAPMGIDVLDNDSDPDGDTLYIDSVTQGSNGTVTTDDNLTPGDPSDDTVVYTPDAGFTGTDSFTYTIRDGNGGTATATVTMDVNATATGGVDVSGGGGSDGLTGSDGDDTINGFGGDDIVFGRNGDDDVKGGSGADSVKGNDGDDRILAGADDDTVVGGAGDDTLAGGSGNDLLNGNVGNDKLLGGTGDDSLFGGAGDDTASGGTGTDMVRGNAGNDLLRGNGGNDTILGGDDDDIVLGGSGDDLIKGQFGDDRLFGNAGNDTIIGGDGNDTIFGGAGDDLLVGGFGSDEFRFKSGSTGDSRISDFDMTQDQINGGGVALTSVVAVGSDALATLDNGGTILFSGLTVLEVESLF